MSIFYSFFYIVLSPPTLSLSLSFNITFIPSVARKNMIFFARHFSFPCRFNFQNTNKINNKQCLPYIPQFNKIMKEEEEKKSVKDLQLHLKTFISRSMFLSYIHASFLLIDVTQFSKTILNERFFFVVFF